MALGTVEGTEVEIDGIASGGAGLGRLPDGRVVFVPRAAPGDRVRIEVERGAERWTRGEILEVLSPGDDRKGAPCPHFARCGGCALQHLEYPAQLRWKAQIVADALTRIGGVETAPPAIEPSPLEFRYRNRVSFSLRRLRSGRVIAGFHDRSNSRRLVDIGPECLLPSEAIASAWAELRGSWGPRACHLPGGDPLRLTLREDAGGVVLVVGGATGPGAPEILLESVPGITSIWAHSEENGYRLLGNRAQTPSPSAPAFSQSNPQAGTALIEAQVATLSIAPGARVIDAYSGTGVLSRRLAEAGAEVVSIESDRNAVRSAQAVAVSGQVIHHGRVEEHLEPLLPADLIFLNPPRSGIGPEVAELLASAGPQDIVYTSCDPATLARDVRRIGTGYRVVSVRCFDLFPQTAHVETLLHLRRSTPIEVQGELPPVSSS